MSTIDFTAQYLVYKMPTERRTGGLVVAILLMIVLMIWGVSQGIFLFAFMLAPIMYVGNIWRGRNNPTEVRELPGTLSVAEDVLRVYVKDSYLLSDGSRYVDHCYLCAREDVESVELDETNMFMFNAKFIRAFAMEDNQVVEQFDFNGHSFTFRASEPERDKIVAFLAENGFPVTYVTEEEEE